MIYKKITARLAHEMLKCVDYFTKKTNIELKCPAIFLRAGDEKIVLAEAIDKCYLKLSGNQKEIVIFDGFYHEIFQELDRFTVFKKLCNRIKFYLSCQ